MENMDGSYNEGNVTDWVDRMEAKGFLPILNTEARENRDLSDHVTY